MDPEIIEQLNEQFREMSEILSQQNSLMAAQVRNMRTMSSEVANSTSSTRSNTSATDDNTTSTRELTEEQRKSVESANRLNKAIGNTVQSLTPFASALLSTTQGLKKYNDAIGQFGQQMADMGKNSGSKLGVIFGHLTDISTKLVEREISNTESLLKFNDEISKFGAVNRFSTEQIREMAHKASLSAQEIDKAMESMKKLGPAFITMGQGATDSTKKYMEFIATTEEERQKFRLMGYATDEERMAAQSMYLETMNTLGMSIRSITTDTDKLKKSSTAYLENLTVLADMTGRTVEEQQQQMLTLRTIREFGIYVANMQAKIEKTTDPTEKARLQNELEKAQMAVEAAKKFGGETVAAGLAEQIMYKISTNPKYLAQSNYLQTAGLDADLVAAVKNDRIKSENFVENQVRDYIAATKDVRVNAMADDNNMFIASVNREAEDMVGFSQAARDELAKQAGLNTVDVANETQAAIDSLNKKLGPAAEDSAQKLRQFVDELEKYSKVNLDKIQKEIGLIPQLIVTGILGLASGGTGMLMARKLGETRSGGGGGSSIASTTRASSNLPKTPTIITDGGKTYTRTPGGVLLPQGMDITDINTKTTKATKPSMLSRLSGSGKYLGRLGGGIGGALGGLALNAGADMAAEAGYTKTSGMLSAGSYAATGAGLGAMFGPIGALVGGLAGGAYGLYQNWDIITGKKKPQTSQQELQTSSIANIDTSFNSAVISFGRMVTSFGKIVTAHSKATIGFIAASKKIEKNLDGLGQLSASDKGKKHDTINVTAAMDTSFNSAVISFGRMVTSFGIIVEAYGKSTKAMISAVNALEKLGVSSKIESAKKEKELLGSFSNNEDGSLIDYIKNLKIEFEQATKATDNMMDAETKRHNFNEMSMLKFRLSIEDLTEKFKILASITPKPGGIPGAPGIDYPGGTPGADVPQDVTGNLRYIAEALRKKGFEDENYINAVLGNVMKESGGQMDRVEDISGYANTSNARIRNIFKKARGMSDAELNALKSDPQAFANVMYANKGGNKEPVDGWKFRGRGPIQLTGRENYEKASRAIFGDDRLVRDPDLVLRPDVGAEVVAWYMYTTEKSMRRSFGFDKNQMLSKQEAALLATSQIAGQKIIRGSGYLGTENLQKVETYAASMSSVLRGGPHGNPGGLANLSNASLKELVRKGIIKLGGGVTGNIDNLENINPDLERRLVSAILEYNQKTNKPVTLTSGFRYPGDQAKINSGSNPKAAPGNSRHERGLAIDFNSSDVSAMNSLGLLEKFGLIGGKAKSIKGGYMNDPPHIEIKAAQGGIFDGPSSGYPAELHGSEMVAPLDTNSILMKLATTPASATPGDITTATSTIEKEIIEKISTTNLETMQALLDKFDSLINAIEEGNSVRDKMYKTSMI